MCKTVNLVIFIYVILYFLHVKIKIKTEYLLYRKDFILLIPLKNCHYTYSNYVVFYIFISSYYYFMSQIEDI